MCDGVAQQRLGQEPASGEGEPVLEVDNPPRKQAMVHTASRVARPRRPVNSVLLRKLSVVALAADLRLRREAYGLSLLSAAGEPSTNPQSWLRESSRAVLAILPYMKTYSVILGLLLVLSASEASAAPTVVISEFMAVNNSTLADEDGTYSDWIELYNSSTNTVNLGGWHLADSATNLTHWQFPSTNLGPNRFLVVFASNKDRRISGAPLHTNFKLSGSGEYLALVQPDGVTKAS
jgi:hypothetical protein